MSLVMFNDLVQASAERVWETLGKFGEISIWHPAITDSKIEGDGPDGLPGCIRRLELSNGAVLREQLLMLDVANKSFSYRFLESPLPVDNYVATVKLIPVTGKNETVVCWQASFEAHLREETNNMEEVVMDLIMSGHHSLAAYLQQQ